LRKKTALRLAETSSCGSQTNGTIKEWPSFNQFMLFTTNRNIEEWSSFKSTFISSVFYS